MVRALFCLLLQFLKFFCHFRSSRCEYRRVRGKRIAELGGSGPPGLLPPRNMFRYNPFCRVSDLRRFASMSDLASKTCVPCRGGTPPLAGAELDALAKQVPEWKVVEGHHITGTFK